MDLLPVTLLSYPILGQYCPKNEQTRNRSCKLRSGILLYHFPSSLHVSSDTHHHCNFPSDSLLPPQPTWHSSSAAQQDLLKPLRPTHSFHYITPPRDWPWNHLTWSWQSYLEGLCKWMNCCFTPSSVNINDPHSISLPFLHFTRWLHLVVAHFTT